MRVVYTTPSDCTIKRDTRKSCCIAHYKLGVILSGYIGLEILYGSRSAVLQQFIRQHTLFTGHGALVIITQRKQTKQNVNKFKNYMLNLTKVTFMFCLNKTAEVS